MLLKNNKSCFCCRQVLILSKREKNRHHKWKLSVPGRGGQKFRQKFLSEGPPPICCQFVILLKSNSWQHIWASGSILTFCRKSAHFRFWAFSEFSKNLHFPVFEVLKHREGLLSPTNQHRNSLGVILLRNNMCCFCCWKLLILLNISCYSLFFSAAIVCILTKSTIFCNKNNTCCF